MLWEGNQNDLRTLLRHLLDSFSSSRSLRSSIRSWRWRCDIEAGHGDGIQGDDHFFVNDVLEEFYRLLGLMGGRSSGAR